MEGLAAILKEIEERRSYQVDLGYTVEHDYGEHDAGVLASSAAALTISAACVLYPANGTPLENEEDIRGCGWMLPMAKWEPSYDNPRDDLITAIALLVSEVQRIDYESMVKYKEAHT